MFLIDLDKFMGKDFWIVMNDTLTELDVANILDHRKFLRFKQMLFHL